MLLIHARLLDEAFQNQFPFRPDLNHVEMVLADEYSVNKGKFVEEIFPSKTVFNEPQQQDQVSHSVDY